MLNKKRPVNLALTTFKFPPMAIASILHRLTGLFLAFLIPFTVYLFSCSLQSETSFKAVQGCLSHPVTKLGVWAGLSALAYHLLAGIRHMIMDLGYGEDVNSARLASTATMALGAFVSFLMGLWLW